MSRQAKGEGEDQRRKELTQNIANARRAMEKNNTPETRQKYNDLVEEKKNYLEDYLLYLLYPLKTVKSVKPFNPLKPVKSVNPLNPLNR